jgi:hypothetical protein
MPDSILYSLAASLFLALVGSISSREHKKRERLQSAKRDFFAVIARLRARHETMRGQEVQFFDESSVELHESIYKLRVVLPKGQWTLLLSIFEEYKNLNRNQLRDPHEIALEVTRANLAGEIAMFPKERLDSFLVRFATCVRRN